MVDEAAIPKTMCLRDVFGSGVGVGSGGFGSVLVFCGSGKRMVVLMMDGLEFGEYKSVWKVEQAYMREAVMMKHRRSFGTLKFIVGESSCCWWW